MAIAHRGPHWAFRAIILVFLGYLSTPRANAWEVSLDQTTAIENQGAYGYCVYYGLANFFEIWANENHGFGTPGLSAAYLAMASNYEWNSGEGQILSWAWIAAAKHGIIPQGAVDTSSQALWPRPEWETDQLELQPLLDLERGLTAEYKHPQIKGSFYGPQYLDKVIKIDMTDVRFVHSSHREPVLPFTGSGAKSFRYGSFLATHDHAMKSAQMLGINAVPMMVKPDKLYEAIKYQLYQQRPVPVVVLSGLTRKGLGYYSVVGNGDLVARGEARSGQHLLTAVGHCDQWKTDDQLCEQFAPLMEYFRIPECIAFENSWGIGANNKGYLCISKIASKRILREAAVMSGSLAAVQ